MAAPEIAFEATPPATPAKRLTDLVRSYRRRDDLTGQLPLTGLEPLKLPHENDHLALTPGFFDAAYAGRGVDAALLTGECGYVERAGAAGWWAPSGREFYSPRRVDTPAQELAFARAYFFLPHRSRSPFDTDAAPAETVTTYDPHVIMLEETVSPLGDRATVGLRDLDPTKPLRGPGHNYRVMKPALMMEPTLLNTAGGAATTLSRRLPYDLGRSSAPALYRMRGRRGDAHRGNGRVEGGDRRGRVGQAVLGPARLPDGLGTAAGRRRPGQAPRTGGATSPRKTTPIGARVGSAASLGSW